MLTIKINGREEKLYIGCRTFVPLDEILSSLQVEPTTVTLNGKKILLHEFAKTTIKNGDALKLAPYESGNHKL